MILDTSITLRHNLALARKREREIATKGVTNIHLPNGLSKSKTKCCDHSNAAITLVDRELQIHDKMIHGLAVRIHQEAQLAQQMMKKHQQSMACRAMRKLKADQQEYIQSMFAIEALEAFKEHVEYGLISMKQKPEITIGKIKNDASEAKTLDESDWTDDSLLLELERHDFFPILDTKRDTLAIRWSDTPPFATHDVAVQRALQTATRGCTDIRHPTGYTTIRNLSNAANTVLQAMTGKVEEFQKSLYEFDSKIHDLAMDAKKHLGHGDVKGACASMQEVEKVQQQYLNLLKRVEGLKIFESDIRHGLVDLKLAGDAILDICSVSSNRPSWATRSDEMHLARLEKKRFYPKLFPILGGGVKIYYSEHAPDRHGGMVTKPCSVANLSSSMSSSHTHNPPSSSMRNFVV